jgi:rare lipoprotein A
VARPTTASEAANAAVAPTAPDYIPFQVLSYSAIQDFEPVAEPTGTPIRMVLGTFDNEDAAREVATELALLGAVDTTTVVQGEQTVTHLMLSHLREGVTAADAQELATSLGLSPTILY